MDAEKIIKEIEVDLAANSQNAETEIINQAKKKGDDFEKFVAQKFPKKYYTIKEWAGDKYINGVYAETTTNPDLVMELKLEKFTKTFAVECKWRKSFSNDKVSFASKRNLENYKNFQNKKNIPVFITLGIGGEPSSPDQLYILPLNDIHSGSISQDDLKQYRRYKIEKDFYYDIKKKELR
ncbi:MAG: hypothetical protein ACEPOZ_19995 [Marinifilaceae bacterium]